MCIFFDQTTKTNDVYAKHPTYSTNTKEMCICASKEAYVMEGEEWQEIERVETTKFNQHHVFG